MIYIYIHIQYIEIHDIYIYINIFTYIEIYISYIIHIYSHT